MSSGKGKESGPEHKLGRDNRDKKEVQAGCPRSSLTFEVPQMEHQSLCVVCMCYHNGSKERVYKLKCYSGHFFDAFPASVVHFLPPLVPKILLGGPGDSRETDSINVHGSLTTTGSRLAM